MEVKILCHSCDGKKYVMDTEFETGKTVKIPCPECSTRGYVTNDLYEGKE